MTNPELDPHRFVALHRLASARIPATRLRHHIRSANGKADQLLKAMPNGPLTDRQIERLKTASASSLNQEFLIRTATQRQVRAICVTDPSYPKALIPYDDAPAILFVRGDLPADGPSIAIVGSRRPDPYGTRQARRFAEAFIRKGWLVVSGGAAGIDATAHAAAVETNGTTVAVVGCGLDVDYPASNRSLFERIAAAGGCIVSEMPLGTRPEPWLFPVRNRIIAAWADATLVVEAPRDSGALITARNAAEYGKDVFVVPGPVDTGRSTGGHLLIRDGAMLADSPEDILSEWSGHIGVHPAIATATPEPTLEPLPPRRPGQLPPDQIRLWEAAQTDPIPLEVLAANCGLEPAAAGMAATFLEMEGFLMRHPGNRYARACG